MGFLKKVRHAIEKGVRYIAKIDDAIEHGNRRLDAYQAKLDEAVGKLQGNIDAIQGSDVANFLAELAAVREQLARVLAILEALDLGDDDDGDEGGE